jgi:hypothetical protein
MRASPAPHHQPVDCNSQGKEDDDMTGSDLILLAPWIAFGVGLAVILLRLRLLRRRRQRMSPQVQPPGHESGERFAGNRGERL